MIMGQSPQFIMVISDKDDSASGSDDSTTKSDSDTKTETDVECRPARDSQPFDVGDVVSARLNDGIYKAKVLKRDYKNKKWFYYIHYFGWKKSYDEWIEAERLVEDLPLKPKKQRSHKKKLDVEKNAKQRDFSLSKPNTSVGKGKKRKRKNDSFDKEKSDVPSEEDVGLQIPSSLMKQLIADYEFINCSGKLVSLPRCPSVELILKKYLDHRRYTSKSVEEIISGLQSFFDKAVRINLLYKKERPQIAYVDEVVPLSKVYGAEHLLRLLVKLPELLNRANIEDETVMELQDVVGDLLKFLQENQKDFFQPEYWLLADAETSTNN